MAQDVRFSFSKQGFDSPRGYPSRWVLRLTGFFIVFNIEPSGCVVCFSPPHGTTRIGGAAGLRSGEAEAATGCPGSCNSIAESVTLFLMEQASILVVLNPATGSLNDTKELTALVSRCLEKTERRLVLYETKKNEEPAEVVRQMCERGVELVIVAGGDGTVGSVVNGMVGMPVPLGIIPVGTGNLLARTLGIPLEPKAALALALSVVSDAGVFDTGENVGEKTSLDVLKIANRYCILNVSIGVSANSIRDTSRQDKQRFRMMAYAVRVAGHLLGFRVYNVNLTVDGRRHSAKATEVLVSNGELLDGLSTFFGSVKSLQDGRLEAYVVEGRSLIDYIVVVLRKLTGTDRTDRHYEHLAITSEITVASGRHEIPVQGDGEVIGLTPVTITVVPRGVQIVVPATEQTSGA